MQKHDAARWIWPGASAVLAGLVLAGCNGSNNGGLVIPTPRPSPNPTTSPTTNPTANPTTSPTTVPTTAPTTAPTTNPVATPTPPPVTNGPVIVFSAGGTLTNGQFVQQGDGNFWRFNLIPETPATPVPTSGPSATPQSITLYTGTYTLSDGESGQFTLADSSFDFAAGSPNIPTDRTFDATNPVEQGTATIAVSVSGSTGSGTITLSNGITGTITITGSQQISALSARSLHLPPQAVRH
jgi:hypothetical protein